MRAESVVVGVALRRRAIALSNKNVFSLQALFPFDHICFCGKIRSVNSKRRLHTTRRIPVHSVVRGRADPLDYLCTVPRESSFSF